MPLVPQPPPSPLGQSSSPPKHQCSPSLPCTIRLSEIGKCWHAFPKGSFKARFAPPAVPRSVLHHFDAHPFFWSWTTKAGPNAGKSFAVPTVPTSCPKDSPKATQWVVSIFHAFKAQLAPQALDPETGRVLPSYVKIYQNNMLMHLRAQRARPRAGKPPPPPPPRAPTRPVAPIPSKSPSVIAELRAEIAALRSEVQALRTLHEASLLTPLSPRTAPTVVPPHSPTHSSSSSSMSIVQERTAHPQHQWLQGILDYPRCPTFLHHVDSSMVPLYSHALPDDVERAVSIRYSQGAPRYVGFDSNGDLCVAENAPQDVVEMTIAPPPSVPNFLF